MHASFDCIPLWGNVHDWGGSGWGGSVRGAGCDIEGSWVDPQCTCFTGIPSDLWPSQAGHHNGRPHGRGKYPPIP